MKREEISLRHQGEVAPVHVICSIGLEEERVVSRLLVVVYQMAKVAGAFVSTHPLGPLDPFSELLVNSQTWMTNTSIARHTSR